MPDTNIPHFLVQPNEAEIVFTFYYRLGYGLSIKEIPDGFCGDGYVRREWKDTAAAHYITDRFLEILILSHFHINPSICGSDNLKEITRDPISKDVSIDSYPPFFLCHRILKEDDKHHHESIGAIECTIFKNGYLALVVRLTNRDPIDNEQLVHLLRHVEVAKHCTGDKSFYFEALRDNALPTDINCSDRNAGELVQLAMAVADEIQNPLRNIIRRLDISSLSIESGRTEKLGNLKELSVPDCILRSRPYLGVIYKRPETLAEFGIADKSVREGNARFIIALARTTPAFLGGFEDPVEYLEGSDRDVYGVGASTVYVARRGWCVFDARQHDPDIFRIGVIETVHFVIMLIDTEARARRHYLREIQEPGKKSMQVLNQSLAEMVVLEVNKPFRLFRGFPKLWEWERDYAEKVTKATGFIARATLVSPRENQGQLAAAHILSHSARTAVDRCTYLTHLQDLDEQCKDKLYTYKHFINLSAHHHRIQAWRNLRVRLLLTSISAVAGILTIIGLIKAISS